MKFVEAVMGYCDVAREIKPKREKVRGRIFRGKILGFSFVYAFSRFVNSPSHILFKGWHFHRLTWLKSFAKTSTPPSLTKPTAILSTWIHVTHTHRYKKHVSFINKCDICLPLIHCNSCLYLWRSASGLWWVWEKDSIFSTIWVRIQISSWIEIQDYSILIRSQHWQCVVSREIDFLLKFVIDSLLISPVEQSY